MSAAVQPIQSPAPGAMLVHLEHLFGGYLDGCHDGKIELAWTNTRPDETGKYKLSNAAFFGTDQFEELVAEAVRLNSTPMCNVYIGAALRKPETPPFGRTHDIDAYALTAGYVDLDDAGAATAAKDVYGETAKPTLVVVTGREPHTRAQLWWRLDEPLTDPSTWPDLLRGMAKAMRGDSSVCNPGRVMRLAGTVAWPVKEGRTAIEMTTIVPLQKPGNAIYAAGHLAAVFPPIAGGEQDGIDTGGAVVRSTNSLGLQTKVNDGRERYMLRTIAAVLLEYIGETGAVPSSQELFDAAWPQYEHGADLTRPGRGKDEFARKCQYTIKRFERGEIRGLETVDKAVAEYAKKRHAKNAAPDPLEEAKPQPSSHVTATPFRWVDGRAIPPREWIYGRHYIRKFLSSTVAPGGLGKSSLVIAEALCICTGRPLLGVQVDERTNVWMWNGEDPQDELDRRVMATALQYNLSEPDIDGKLFVDNGRQTPIVIAERTRDGIVINAPLVEQVTATIRANSIGVLIIDPFIACHRVTENDNNEIDRVAKIWAAIADETGCSIELIHHVRKATGNEIQVEDGRGAGALLAAARAARALNRMSEEEGAKAGVEDHRFYFRADDGKANLAPPSANAKWFQMTSFDLQNETLKRPSDKIGVVAQWAWPDHTEGVTASDMHEVRKRVTEGKWRADSQASDWVGYAIIEALGGDVNEPNKAKAKSLQAMWIKTGALKIVTENDQKRNPRKYVRAGNFNE